MRKGWLRINGVQDGDRTLEQQTRALRDALAICAGKTVLDLGCAEGLIGKEFLKAGASRVLGIERETGYIEMARALCKRPGISFEQGNLNYADPEKPLSFDIVLALGIIHKLDDPEIGMRFAARSARELLLLRSGRGSVNGIIRGKYSRRECNSAATLSCEGFVLERVVEGPLELHEPVEYWRRAA